MGKISITVYPNDSKRSKENFRTPLYLRVRKNREKSEIRLNWDISQKERKLWNETFQRVENKSCITNQFLDKIFEKFDQLLISHAFDLDDININDVKLILSGHPSKTEKTPTIMEYVDEYYTKNIFLNKNLTLGTKNNYKKAINHLERFCASKKMTNHKITKVNNLFADEFKTYLLSDNLNHDKITMTEVSALTNIKKFRTIFDKAVSDNLIQSNPFKLIKLSNQSPRKPKLSVFQLQNFFNQSVLSDHDKTNAQIFLFMALTGTAFSDCMNLTMDNLEYTPHGIKLTYTRQKTGNVSCQFLTQKAYEILEIFDKLPDIQLSTRLIPLRSNQYLNRSLKIVAKTYGIPFKLTSHIARHSFRSLLDEADIVDPTVINKIMGWSSRGSMDAIYRDVTDRRLIKTKQQLDDFINLTFSNKSC
jgi:site-specific recombinase XerD